MARLTWLASELRKAGLKVVEVDGWKTRGSADFDPVGITWHATAGSRSGTAQGEVHVILNGSETAPPPIAQIMAWRDGVLYICAAGRCNHNKVGWDGPNKGLGNTKLLGIEMANDNHGEPWPDAQLDAVRRATAVIMRRLGADPMRRLAAHYEHQPYATRPPGEGSTKSDPYGVVMTKERPRVAAIMRGDDDMPTPKDFVKALLDEELTMANGSKKKVRTILGWLDAAEVGTRQTILAAIGALAGKDVTDEPAIIAGVLAGLGGSGQSDEEIAAALRAALGDRAGAVGQLLAA